MQLFQIRGPGTLSGETTVSGAKNSVLPILAACVLCRGPCVLHNCPNITDVDATLAILRALGAKTARTGSTLTVDTGPLTASAVPAAPATRMRSSVLFAGALLARTGRAQVPHPGGCPLGRRPIDLHRSAFEALGACCTDDGAFLDLSWTAPHGACFEFPTVSVGATENAVLAALACPGETVLQNAAAEPEVTDFLNFLRSAGAEITGVGTRELCISGGKPLHGTTYSILPDRIETATFLCAACGCGGDILLRRTDARSLGPLPGLLERMSCELHPETNALRIRRTGQLRPVFSVETAPYPGFPTDCQAALMAALLRAPGESRITETVFETRFHHVPELQKLGAVLQISGNAVRITGAGALHGAAMTAHDLRGGAALVLAALQAEGESSVSGLHHIDRGYERFEQKLRALGADILRTFAG